MFLLDPKSTWAWLALPQGVRDDLKDRLATNVIVERWHLKGIWKRLDQHNKIDSESHCESVLKHTGGWHLLVDELFERNGKRPGDQDTSSDADSICEDLESDNSILKDRFLEALGLGVDGCITQVLELVSRDGPASVDMLVPEMFGDESVVYDSDDYARAVEYLTRMGCLIRDHDTVKAENIVSKALGGRR